MTPNSPYAASKAAGDHLVRAWNHTYKLPTLTTNCSNNYGPRQHPEKLIPHLITCALAGKPLPIYGKGLNTRDWIHVEDHCAGIFLALERGKVGETYCFGGDAERKNIDVARQVCAILDRLRPRADERSYETQLEFVADRPGHDWRYAIDDTLARTELGFTRRYHFEDGLAATVQWYLDNQEWCAMALAPRI
jgi:dTDP-glucose 4,6-dehydratase